MIVFTIALVNVTPFLLMSLKLATNFSKLEKKSSDVIFLVDDVTSEISAGTWKCIVDVVMQQTFADYSIFIREILTTLILNLVFWWVFWLNSNNLWPALGMALEIYKNMTNWLKLKVRKLQGDIAVSREIKKENLERGSFCPQILNRVKLIALYNCNVFPF